MNARAGPPRPPERPGAVRSGPQHRGARSAPPAAAVGVRERRASTVQPRPREPSSSVTSSVAASSRAGPRRVPPSPLSSSQGTVSSVARLGDQHQLLRSDAATLKRNLAFSQGRKDQLSPRRHKPRSTICAIFCTSGARFSAPKAPGSAPDNRQGVSYWRVSVCILDGTLRTPSSRARFGASVRPGRCTPSGLAPVRRLRPVEVVFVKVREGRALVP